MKKANLVSGGKTSSYIAVNYPADYNFFSLVRTENNNCKFPDAKVRQMVSDRLGEEFIGTLEEDTIIYTMLDLEQYIGSEIIWVTGPTFEDLVRHEKILPNIAQRFCTQQLKIQPVAQYWSENINEPLIYRFGFRANEQRRAKNMIERCQEDGFVYQKVIIGKSKNGRNKWQTKKYYKPDFPLISDGIFKDKIEDFWQDKPVRFAYMNNCVGCFHRDPILLKHMSNKCPKQFDAFIEIEKLGAGIRNEQKKRVNDQWSVFKKGMTYEHIKNRKTQLRLFDDDFNECDSGYCGL